MEGFWSDVCSDKAHVRGPVSEGVLPVMSERECDDVKTAASLRAM